MGRALLKRLVALVLAGVLVHGALHFLVDSGFVLRSPWSRDYGEGCVLAMAQLLSEHGTYFPTLRGYPLLVANYPPVFIALTAALHIAFGPSLRGPRLLSFLSTLGLLAVLYPLLRRLSGARWIGAALTALFVLPWFVTSWAALARVDMLSLLLSLAGLAVVERHGASARAWPALPLFWLAFFTKQTALVAPVAVVFDLLVARDRRAARALVAWGVPFAFLFAALVVATGGEAWRHLVLYTAAASYEWGRMAASYVHLAAIAGPLLILVAGGFALTPRAFLTEPGRVFFIYFLLKLATFATIAKEGAAQNYFIEPWLATVPVAAVAVRVLGERFPHRSVLRPAALLLAAVTAHSAYSALGRLPRALHHPERAREFVGHTRLVRQTPGPILSENLSVLVVNRKPVLVEPFGVLLLARKGLLRPDLIVRDCEGGRFALVIKEDRLDQIPGVGGCLERRYELVADLGPYQALVPRARPRAPAAGR
jgi:hypothetical protein